MYKEINTGEISKKRCSKSGGNEYRFKYDATQVKMSISMDQDEEINRLSNE